MSRLQNIGAPRFLKWVSFLYAERNFTLSKSNLYANGSYNLVQRIRLYGTDSSTDSGEDVDFSGKGKRGRALREQAQAALAEYFHSTRSFRVMDAENMSRNAPAFFDKLMKRVNIDDGTIRHAVTRFLRYNPVNEFEPFFESIGLKPSEYVQYLPKNLMFVADDELLLENYYVLCNYGIERNRIGKIFKEVNEVCHYDYGALQPILRSFENLGLRQSIVAKVIASSPQLLRRNVEFVEFLDKLKKLVIDYDWLLDHIREEESYDWKGMLRLMCLLCKLGWSKEQLGKLFKHHPDLLLECSGRITFGLIAFLLKVGSTVSDVQTLFLQFPQIPVSKFTHNFHNSYDFLVKIDMAAQDISWIVRSYPILLGSIELKKMNSILTLLSCGKGKVCQMVKDDPFTLKEWVRGKKLEQLEIGKKSDRVRPLKTQFLLSLGFEENTKDMEMALKAIRGRGEELQQRFDCLVKNGMSREEGIKMVKKAPQILNQSSDAIESKIRFFLDVLGYRLSDLLAHPKIPSYTIKRMKLRLLTYKWLKDKGLVRKNMSLNTLLVISDEVFVKAYVNPHVRVPEFWKSLNKKCGKGKVCQMVKGDLLTLKEWVRGKKLEQLENGKKSVKVRALKTQFLLSLGFEENSKDMEMALKVIRGRGEELQQRFDCLVKNGMSREEGIKMVKMAPQILNQGSAAIESKIRFFLDVLGYRLSDLLAHPKIPCYTINRMKLRLLTYKWLKDKGLVLKNVSLNTLLASSDEVFVKAYVNPHARGPEFWKSLNKKCNSTKNK